MNTTRVE